MTGTLRVRADLRFEVAPGGTGADRVTGTVRGDGTHLELACDRLDLLAGLGAGRGLRAAARAVAGRGLTVAVGGAAGPVLTIGAVRPRLLHRLLTGSPYVRVHDWRAAARLRTSRANPQVSASLPAVAVLGVPPGTPWPPAPTFRRGRRVAGTTHDPRGGGRPRLVFAMGRAPAPGATQRVVDLPPRRTVIGSGPEADLRLEGLQPLHAEVHRDSQDEYVLVPLGDPARTRVNGGVAERHVLRTGSRIELGPWTLSYRRDEYADHGRPYGGREGGEGSRQRPQVVPRYRPQP